MPKRWAPCRLAPRIARVPFDSTAGNDSRVAFVQTPPRVHRHLQLSHGMKPSLSAKPVFSRGSISFNDDYSFTFSAWLGQVRRCSYESHINPSSSTTYLTGAEESSSGPKISKLTRVAHTSRALVASLVCDSPIASTAALLLITYCASLLLWATLLRILQYLTADIVVHVHSSSFNALTPSLRSFRCFQKAGYRDADHRVYWREADFVALGDDCVNETATTS